MSDDRLDDFHFFSAKGEQVYRAIAFIVSSSNNIIRIICPCQFIHLLKFANGKEITDKKIEGIH
jgi:hypothetical protein